jgi:hypothetical protein
LRGRLEGCVDEGRQAWNYRVAEIEHGYGLGFNIDEPHRTHIDGPEDDDIDADTCLGILNDLYPFDFFVQGVPVPRQERYVVPAFVRAHEEFHVTDWRERVVRPVLAALEAEFGGASLERSCLDPALDRSVQEQFVAAVPRLEAEHRPSFEDGRHEARAHTFSNALYVELVDQIRARAKREGWRVQCQ